MEEMVGAYRGYSGKETLVADGWGWLDDVAELHTRVVVDQAVLPTSAFANYIH